MKAMKRKLKVAGIFGVCWFGVLVLAVDGVLGFERVVGWFGGYAWTEVALWVAVLLPTTAVYRFTQENPKEFDKETEQNT